MEGAQSAPSNLAEGSSDSDSDIHVDDVSDEDTVKPRLISRIRAKLAFGNRKSKRQKSPAVSQSLGDHPAVGQCAEPANDIPEDIVGIDGEIFFAHGSPDPTIKLEVMDSHALNRLLLVWILSFCAALCLAVLYSILANTVFSKPLVYSTGPGADDVETIAIYDVSSFSALIFPLISGSLASVILLFLTFSFAYRLLQTPKAKRKPMQSLAIFLGVISVFGVFPWTQLEYLVFGSSGDIEDDFSLNRDYIGQTLTSLQSFQTVGLLLYVWIKVGSLCILQGPLGIGHYVAKTGFCFLVLAMRLLASYAFGVGLPSFSFLGALGLVLAAVLGIGTPFIAPFQALIMGLYFVMELYILVRIAFNLRNVRRDLRILNYVIFHAEVINFYFFLNNVLQYALGVSVIGIIQIFSSPMEFQRLIIKTTGSVALQGFQPFVGYAFVVVFVTMELVALLPVEAPSFFHFLHPKTNEMKRKVFDIVMKESFGKDGLPEYSPQVFVVETQVMLMNLCALVYKFGNSKLPGNLENLEKRNIQLIAHVSDAKTDTHVCVFETRDKIIIAFRGTKGTTNIIQDLKANLVPLSSILDMDPGMLVDSEPDSASPTSDTLSSEAAWLQDKAQIDSFYSQIRHCRVHAGFGSSYQKISKELLRIVAARIQHSNRIIFVTGHSLGGALCTIASFHIAKVFKLENSPRLVVSTYACPRVGNLVFHQIYTSTISQSWRCVITGDPVPEIPKGRYVHVQGDTLVLICNDGELIVDPSIVEALNYNRPASFRLIRHKMVCYKYGLAVFAKLYASSFDERVLWNLHKCPKQIIDDFVAVEEKIKYAKAVRYRDVFQAVLDETQDNQDKFYADTLPSLAISDSVRGRWITLLSRLSAAEVS